MTDTESKWADRVKDWQASGQSVPAFCRGKDFTPSGLRYWTSRLRKVALPAPPKELRVARVVRVAAPTSAPQPETPIMIEVGGARLAVRRGFDHEALRAVLDVLGGGR